MSYDELLKLGKMFFISGKYSSAERIYKKCCDINELDFRAFFNRAQALTSLNRLSEAADCILTAIFLNPELVETYSFAAALYIRLRDFEKSVHMCYKVTHKQIQNNSKKSHTLTNAHTY